MPRILITLLSGALTLIGFGIFIWGGLRLINRKGLPKSSITSLGIGLAFLALGLGRAALGGDGSAALILGVIFCIMSLIARYWEKSGADWAQN